MDWRLAEHFIIKNSIYFIQHFLITVFVRDLSMKHALQQTSKAKLELHQLLQPYCLMSMSKLGFCLFYHLFCQQLKISFHWKNNTLMIYVYLQPNQFLNITIILVVQYIMCMTLQKLLIKCVIGLMAKDNVPFRKLTFLIL